MTLNLFVKKLLLSPKLEETRTLSRRKVLFQGLTLAATVLGGSAFLQPSTQVRAASLAPEGGPAPDPTPPGVLPSGGILCAYPDASLGQTNTVSSKCGQYQLILQSDGNLVLYDISHQALWSSETYGNPQVSTCNMQTDGNLVIYDTASQPMWASNTIGYDGASLVVQEDGNAVIYDPWGRACWATNTWTTASSTCE